MFIIPVVQRIKSKKLKQTHDKRKNKQRTIQKTTQTIED